MKSHFKLLIGAAIGLTLVTAQAQGPRGGGMMGGPRGPQFTAAMTKLFGDNSAFSATLENQIKISDDANNVMTVPGKIAFDGGKSRFEMDMTQMRGGMLPPNAAEQLKSMGMDKMIIISRPDKKTSYMVYPGMEAYAEMPIQDPDAPKSDADFKIDTAEMGKETVDGHPCIKNKTTVTDDKGEKHEFMLWNATDMKKFPVKLETSERGNAVTMHFKDVKLAKPDASAFEPPAAFKRYTSFQELMQQEVMKRMQNMQGGPGGGPR